MTSIKTPWHLWAIGILAIVWNGFGAFDYYMTQTRNAEYMSAFTPQQLEYFNSFPSWVTAAWAIGIWGAVLGSIFLLLRSRYSVLLFGLSILGLIASTVHNFFLAQISMSEIMGIEAIIITAVIYLAAIGLYFYARTMRSRGVLR